MTTDARTVIASLLLTIVILGAAVLVTRPIDTPSDGPTVRQSENWRRYGAYDHGTRDHTEDRR